MKLYFALSSVALASLMPRYLEITQGRNFLVSFVYGAAIFKIWNAIVSKEKDKEISLILDSGAYSAWKSGTVVDINALTAFAQRLKNEHQFLEFNLVSLDKIPSSPNVKPTQEMIKESGEVSSSNADLIRKKAGINPIEVYHQGEDINFLYRMIEKQENPYVGVSPANDVSATRRNWWLDQVFSVLAVRYPKDHVRTHGFGVTSFNLMKDYPWTSVDSASFNISAGYGTVYLFDPNKPGMFTMNYGVKSGSLQTKVFSNEEWDQYKAFLPESVTEPKDLLSSRIRDIVNMYSFVKAEQWINEYRKTVKQRVQKVIGDFV